jgi:hypothetical protein
MAERFSCAVNSLSVDEPLYGTASQVRRWILVEQPGSWGIDAVAQSGLPEDVATRLRALARTVGARLLLIRRHGRSEAGVRSCFAVVSTADVRRIERFDFEDPADLLGVDWGPLRSFAPVGGEPVDNPLYLVCTNGSHDTCCARFGRPVAAALHGLDGVDVWEASHFGGDRFAGNVVCLPDGIYYGRVTPETAAEVVADHRAGRLSLANLRGRSFSPFVAQAAEYFLRVDRGLHAIDEVLPVQVDDLGDGVFAVALRTGDDADVVVTVECTQAGLGQQLTCRAHGEEHPPRYRLLSLTEGT